MPSTSGCVIPNNQITLAKGVAVGNTNNVVISPSITVNTSPGTAEQNKDLANQVSAAVTQIRDMLGPGGALDGAGRR